MEFRSYDPAWRPRLAFLPSTGMRQSCRETLFCSRRNHDSRQLCLATVTDHNDRSEIDSSHYGGQSWKRPPIQVHWASVYPKLLLLESGRPLTPEKESLFPRRCQAFDAAADRRSPGLERTSISLRERLRRMAKNLLLFERGRSFMQRWQLVTYLKSLKGPA